MTNKEAIIAVIGVSGFSEALILKALIEQDIDPDEEYDGYYLKVLDLIAYDILVGMLAVEKIQEGGYGITYSIEGIKARIAWLERKYPELAPIIPVPTLRDKSYLW